jgi:predicted glycoside hydrolase/deacetylase ChbG (UPF0249 family)
MNDAAPPRRIWLCADDYGLSPGVNRAIRDLIERGRLNATSVMVVGPAIGRDEVARCRTPRRANSPRCAIGLHATLTAPFRPLTMHFQAARWRHVPAVSEMLRAACCGGSILKSSMRELMVQLAAFKEMFGRAPDFVDGHQHAQLFPQVRDAFLRAVKAGRARRLGAPGRTPQPLAKRLGAPKALLLDVLSAQFRKRAARAGIAFNPGLCRRL